jgi:hypothetical protein
MLVTYKGSQMIKILISEEIPFFITEDTLTSLIPLHSTLMTSYERGLNQSTLINCVHEALLSALIMLNIAQMNSAYGEMDNKNSFV